MSIILPRFNPNQQIPNGPFYSLETWTIGGGTGSFIMGTGLNVSLDGVLSATGGGGGGGVTSVTAGFGLTGGTITTSGTIALAALAPSSAGTYSYPSSVTVDGYGRVTAASTGATPIFRNAFTAKGQVLVGSSIGNFSALSVGSNGQVLSADSSTGSGLAWVAPNLGTVTTVTGTAPVVITGTATATPNVTVTAATTAAPGVVQLNNSLTSTSTTLALTAAQGKILQDQISSILSAGGGSTLAGTLDASTGNLVTVTSLGAGAGFTAGSPLPAAAAGNENYYVIVTTGGNYTPPGGAAVAATQGDWFLSSNSAWQFLNVGPSVPSASATAPGVVELATALETQTGTDTTRAVTPAGGCAAYVRLAQYAAKGEILAADGANSPIALGVGSDGQVLTACAVCNTGMTWAAAPGGGIPATLIDNPGDLIVGLSADTPGILGVGNDGEVLVACAACTGGMTWFAAGASNATPTVAGVVKGLTSANNVALGCQALNSVAAGANNTALGFRAATALTSGLSNTAVGELAGCSLTSACFNVLVGGASGCSITTACCNVLVGGAAGNSISTGDANVALGDGAGFAITTGDRNVVIGPQVQVADGTQSCQLALGFANGSNWLTGDSTKNIRPGAGIVDCTGVAGSAGQFLQSTGSNSICWSFLPNATPANPGVVEGCTSFNLSSLGFGAGQSFGAQSVAIGLQVGGGNNGSCNVGVGALAVQIGSGSCNVGVGYRALNDIDGNNNVAIGYNAQPSANTANNEITLGNSSTAVIRAQVTTITSLSDARDKKDVVALPVGLDFVRQLTPVKFTWEMREESDLNGTEAAGFIAQELDEVQKNNDADYLKLVYHSNPERLEASAGHLLPVVIKALQELADKVDSLQAQLDKLS